MSETPDRDQRGVTVEFHPVADIFPMMSEQEYADLVADIGEHGLREPIWLHHDGRIIDGRNRWRACVAAGVEPVTRTYEGADESLVSFVLSLNLHRRHLNESQRAMVAARIEQYHHGGARQDANLHLDRDDAAGMLGVSARSVASAKKVQEHGSPELAAGVDAGAVAVSTAATLADAPADVQRDLVAALDTDDEAQRRAAEKDLLRAAAEIRARKKDERLAEKAAAVARIAGRPALPLDSLGPFPVLYADPPWRYDFAEDETRQVENHYPTMTTEEIAKLDVPAAADSVLFLWVPSPKLRHGLDVMDAWGFDYRTCMVWVKDKWGMGYYARQQHELLLIGKRGNLPVPDPEDRPSSVIEAPRGEHSAKPDVVYELIERMYPLREWCELFARSPRPRWAAWGNQVEP